MSDVKDNEFYPRSARGLEDAGAERETRRRPCTRRTWCLRELDHDGACVEAPRPTSASPRPAWDLRTPDPKHWRELRPKPAAASAPVAKAISVPVAEPKASEG